MKVFILILTLMNDGGYDGQGGLATAEFLSKKKCVEAGEMWRANTKLRTGWKRLDKSIFYICTEK